MKKTSLSIILFLVSSLSFTAFANDKLPDTALSGYDPVAYFDQIKDKTIVKGKAMRGSGFNVATHDGQKFLFATKENMKMFKKNPKKYLPAYNGWCAYGVSVKKKFHADPTVFEVVNGKLYLNLDTKIQETWKKEMQANIVKADKLWPKIAKKSMASL